MKRIGFLILIIAFSYGQLTAQELNFGIKAGINIAKLTEDISDDFGSRTAFHLGVMVEYSITEEFSFQPELLYSAQGAQDNSSSEKEKLKIDYLNLPLMAKYYIINGLNIEAGPQLGLLLSATSEIDGGDEDFKDELKNIDFGINLGAGYKLDNGLNVGARYNFSLSNINDVDGLGTVKNSVIQFLVGFYF